MKNEAQSLLAYAINRYGDGDHPEATMENLGFFTDEYKLEIAYRVMDKLNEDGQALMRSVIDGLLAKIREMAQG